MAEIKDLYKLGQSQKGSIENIGEEIRIDLNLEDNTKLDVGSVFGKITDENEQPVEGVTVKVTDTDYNPLYHAITDVNGEYVINDIKAESQYLIFAAKDNYNLEEGLQFVMQPSQQIQRKFNITVNENASKSLVAGEVLNDKEEPIEGATVMLYDNKDSENPVLIKTTHTNQYGQYACFDISQGIYYVASSIMGYKKIETSFVISEEDKVRNIILTMEDDSVTRMGTINGIIKDKNANAVENAYVILFESILDDEGKETLNPIRRTMTNDEGLYLFEQVPKGNYKIKANKASN